MRVIGHIESMVQDSESGTDTAFESVVMGGNLPSNFILAVEKGTLAGNPISGVCMVLSWVLCIGMFHVVDSSELAFRVAAYLKTKPVILEPNMTVDF